MQNKIQLIAKTTRANGKSSYIVSPNNTLSYSDITSLIIEAYKNPQADNYISVSNKEAQLKLEKIEPEILVLVGIDGLKSQEREHALQFLNQRLKDMENLVTQKFEWHMEEQVLKMAELAKWENDLTQDLLGFILKERLKTKEKNAIQEKKVEDKSQPLSKTSEGVLDEIDIPEKCEKEKVATQEVDSPKPTQNTIDDSETKKNDFHNKNWWLFIIIAIVMLLGAACLFLPACNVLFTKPPATKKPPVTVETPPSPYKDLAHSLCELYKWCDNNTEQALRSEFDEEEIVEFYDNLNQPWAFLTSSLDNKVYLEDLVDFDKGYFQQIIAQQQKLRNGFAAVQIVDTLSLEPLDSEEYPVLSFLYKMNKAYTEIPKDKKELPFFTNNDVKRAKVLANLVDDARYNRLIDNGRMKVFDSLCLLSDDKTVDVLYNRENQVRKLCIIPNKDFPTERQCEKIETEEQKTQAQVFLKIRTEINKALACGS